MEENVQNLRQKVLKSFEESDRIVHMSKPLGLGIIHLKDGIIFEEKLDGSKKVIGALKTKEK